MFINKFEFFFIVINLNFPIHEKYFDIKILFLLGHSSKSNARLLNNAKEKKKKTPLLNYPHLLIKSIVMCVHIILSYCLQNVRFSVTITMVLVIFGFWSNDPSVSICII